jgi:hypothetical protein
MYVYRVIEIGTRDVTEEDLANSAAEVIQDVVHQAVGADDPQEQTLVLPFNISELHQHISGKEEIGRALATVDDAMDHIRHFVWEINQGARHSLQQRRDELAELLDLEENTTQPTMYNNAKD